MDNEKLEKIENQLELLILKVDIIMHKMTHDRQIQSHNSDNVTDDELYSMAMSVVIKAGMASAALLQRHLKIGYAKAAGILDILEEQGVIGPADGAKPRKILVKE